MASDLEIIKTLVLSTAHIQSSTADRFMRGQTNLDLDFPEYGWQVRWPSEDYEDQVDDDLMVMPELKPIWDLCKKHGCRRVLFDADGPACSELRLFEW